MTRHDLCAVGELPPGRSRVFDLGELTVVVARSGEKVFALEDRCSHDDGEFDDARIIPASTPTDGTDDGGAQIECPRHGARFDLATGRATRMPAVTAVEAFSAGVEDGRIWIDVPPEWA